MAELSPAGKWDFITGSRSAGDGIEGTGGKLIALHDAIRALRTNTVQ
jgi:hypothetical protein